MKPGVAQVVSFAFVANAFVHGGAAPHAGAHPLPPQHAPLHQPGLSGALAPRQTAPEPALQPLPAATPPANAPPPPANPLLRRHMALPLVTAPT